MVLTKNDELYSFGYNNYGQLGNGTLKIPLIPHRIFNEKKVKTVSLSK